VRRVNLVEDEEFVPCTADFARDSSSFNPQKNSTINYSKSAAELYSSSVETKNKTDSSTSTSNGSDRLATSSSAGSDRRELLTHVRKGSKSHMKHVIVQNTSSSTVRRVAEIISILLVTIAALIMPLWKEFVITESPSNLMIAYLN
jgi:cobalamin biosynthesis Mg chelatase CobN